MRWRSDVDVDGCRDPLLAIAAFGGVALGGVAILDWHYALEYVGTVGLLLSFVNWFTSYDRPQVSHTAHCQFNTKKLLICHVLLRMSSAETCCNVLASGTPLTPCK